MNRKIRNATPVTVDGITFRSKLESNVYLYLKSKGITPQFETERFVLTDDIPIGKIRYYNRIGRNYMRMMRRPRPITYTPDMSFTYKGYKVYVEVKGYMNDTFPLKAKMFLSYLSQQPDSSRYVYAVIRSIVEIDYTLNDIDNTPNTLNDPLNL